MDAKERARLKSLNALRIENFGIYLGKANEAKAVMDTKLAKLNSREVNDMYTQSYKDSEIAKVKQTFQATMAELYNKEIDPGLTALESSIEEQYSEVDAEALQATINILKTSGTEMDGETLRKLFIPFAHDQNALRVLQSTVKALGMKYDGGIDKMIYDRSSMFGNLKSLARDTFQYQNSSIFKFGVEFGKLATFEGVSFPLGEPFPSMKNPPPTDNADAKDKTMTDAARKAAGLPPEGPKGPEGK
jgi:uncharacterized protein (UPF0128 family)